MSEQKGNTLFLILIAMALFAALSYAVTQSSRSASNINKEEAEIAAAQIIQYASQIEHAIMRMQIISGCSDEEISFVYDSNNDGNIDSSDDYYNSKSPPTKECHVFDTKGGNLSWTDPQNAWMSPGLNLTYHIPKTSCIKNMGSNGSGASASGFCNDVNTATELLLTLPGLTEAICASLNKNISGDSTIPVDASHHLSGLAAKFDGTYGSGREIGDHAEILTGQPTYCYQGAASADVLPGAYVFYHVLIAR